MPQQIASSKAPGYFEVALYAGEHSASAAPITLCLTDGDRLGETIAALLGLRACLATLVRPAIGASAADVAGWIAELPEALAAMREGLSGPIVDHAYPSAGDPRGEAAAIALARKLAAMVEGGHVHVHPSAAVVLMPGEAEPVAVIYFADPPEAWQ